MTPELIESFRKIVKPYMAKRLIFINYENMGEQDKADFERDFDEILDLAIKALQTEPSEDLKDALHIAQTDRDKWATRAKKLAKIIGIRDCDIDEYKQEHCEDAISRKAAISVANSFDATQVVRGLEKLPSVQPEIIRCYQCKYAEVADSEDSQDGYTCKFHRESIWFSGSYCSWAERRQDGKVSK